MFALLAAPFIGSVIGVLIRRLPVGRPVGWARSACDSCSHVLAPRDLVPVASFVWLGGRCRLCRAPIGWFHLVVELAALLVAVWAIAAGQRDTGLWLSCVLGWGLLALAWIDWSSWRLPDALSLPLLLVGLGATWALQPEALAAHAIAAVVGYVALRGIELVYRLWRGRAGLGQGDAKVLAAGGAWLGAAALPAIAVVAALLGIALALLLHRRRVAADSAIPFGPALALTIWLTWLYRLP